MMDWLAMGGYGAYVWSTYGLLCLGLVCLFVHVRRTQAQVARQLSRWLLRADA